MALEHASSVGYTLSTLRGVSYMPEITEREAPVAPAPNDLHPENWRRLVGLALLCLVGLLAFLWWATSTPSGRQQTHAQGEPPIPALSMWQAPAPAVEMKKSIGPAPVLRRGPDKRVRGKIMATWKATGAGDGSYNGVYVASGTAHGQPSYTNGAKWLYFNGSVWEIGDIVDDPTSIAYIGGSTLPANPWSTDVVGTAPAPTLSELTIPVEPPDFVSPYPWEMGPVALSPSPIKPCLATIGGADYVAMAVVDAIDGTGLRLFNRATDTWTTAAISPNLFANWDTYQSGGLFDGGDGSTLHAISGAYLDGSTPKFIYAPITVTNPTTAEVGSPVAVTLPALDCSNFLETSAGNWRFICRSATHVYLCTYVAAAATCTTVRTWTLIDALPTGYTPVELGDGLTLTGYTDHCLLTYGTATYWLRHCVNASHNHRVVPYQLHGATTLMRVDSILDLGYSDTDYLQTWGDYHSFAGTQLVGDVGTDCDHITTALWRPEEDGTTRVPFAGVPSGRRWYLGENVLAGWTMASYYNIYPWVMDISPQVADIGTVKSATAIGTLTAVPYQVVGIGTIKAATKIGTLTAATTQVVDLGTIRAGARLGTLEARPVVTRDPGANVMHVFSFKYRPLA